MWARMDDYDGGEEGAGGVIDVYVWLKQKWSEVNAQVANINRVAHYLSLDLEQIQPSSSVDVGGVSRVTLMIQMT